MKRGAEQESGSIIDVRPTDDRVLSEMMIRLEDNPDLKAILQKLINQGFTPIEAKAIIMAESIQQAILARYPTIEEHLPFKPGYDALNQQMAMIAALLISE